MLKNSIKCFKKARKRRLSRYIKRHKTCTSKTKKQKKNLKNGRVSVFRSMIESSMMNFWRIAIKILRIRRKNITKAKIILHLKIELNKGHKILQWIVTDLARVIVASLTITKKNLRVVQTPNLKKMVKTKCEWILG